MDYTLLKKFAKERKISVQELLALAPQNDPFYIGTKTQIQQAEWLARIYEALGSPPEVHIRRIHYLLVSRKDILKPNGEPSKNTENDWDYLVQATKYARYLGLVPIDNFVDRRNPDPHIHAYYWKNETADDILEKFKPSRIAEEISWKFRPYNPQHSLAYHLEIWAEKSTQNDIILPIASDFRMNLVTGLGELSITAVNELRKRIYDANKPVRIFYISDFDPAGENMPISVSRKVEFFIRKEGNDLDVKLKPIMLTKQQCIDYHLPRTPIKVTEKRKTKFEERHGEGATELDALEALYPGEMEGILRQAIKPYVDEEAYEKVREENEKIQKIVQEEIERTLIETFSNRKLELAEDFEMPRGNLVEEKDDWLYDSRNDYLKQLERYKIYRE